MLNHIPFYGSLLGRILEGKIKATSSYVLVYGAIEAHAFGRKGCIASNATIAQETGLTASSVSTILSRLNKAGWIRVKMDKNNHRSQIEPLMGINPLPHLSDPLMGIKPPLDAHQTPLQPPSNIEYSNKKTVRESLPAPTVAGHAELYELVEYVREIQHLRPWVNKPKQFQAAKKILGAGYTLAEAENAADRMTSDDYWKDHPFDLTTLSNQIPRFTKSQPKKRTYMKVYEDGSRDEHYDDGTSQHLPAALPKEEHS